MPVWTRFTPLAAGVTLLLAASVATADVKVEVKQDDTTKLWRYTYTILHDDLIRAMGPGDVEEIALTTRDLMGVDVPIMALLPEGWSVNWEKDEDEEQPLLVWGNFDEKFELKPGGAAATFVLFSTRGPGPAMLTLEDEGGNEADFPVQGPTGD
jgi:hypothetical protein